MFFSGPHNLPSSCKLTDLHKGKMQPNIAPPMQRWRFLRRWLQPLRNRLSISEVTSSASVSSRFEGIRVSLPEPPDLVLLADMRRAMQLLAMVARVDPTEWKHVLETCRSDAGEN